MSQIDLQWFAAEDEGRTEDPSEYKLRKAREEGRVAKSQELNGAIVMLFTVLMLIILAPWIERKLEEMMKFYFRNSTQQTITDGKFASAFFIYYLEIVIPFGIIAALAGFIANIVQNKGFLFTTKTIEPKFDKLIPKFGEYFKKTLFSFEGLFNIGKSILKVVVIGFISYLLIRKEMPNLLAFMQIGGPDLAMKKTASIVAKLLIIATVFLLLVSVADYLVQRHQFIESMKMTKQEQKEEYKELEGDPEVKGHLESAQREMLQTNIPRAVREADVVITNPTHFAVSLQWQRERDIEAPQVTAKGEDRLALNMKQIAWDNDVPVVENKAVARGLYTDTKVGDIIPETYLKVIATIYQQIGYLDKDKKGQKV